MRQVDMNPYFKAPSNSALFDADAFSTARAEFLENRDRFVSRLACAQFFDADRFDAMILWLETLRRFHEANAEPLPALYFEGADRIISDLSTQSKHSNTQREICAAALVRWHEALRNLRS